MSELRRLAEKSLEEASAARRAFEAMDEQRRLRELVSPLEEARSMLAQSSTEAALRAAMEERRALELHRQHEAELGTIRRREIQLRSGILERLQETLEHPLRADYGDMADLVRSHAESARNAALELAEETEERSSR